MITYKINEEIVNVMQVGKINEPIQYLIIQYLIILCIQNYYSSYRTRINMFVVNKNNKYIKLNERRVLQPLCNTGVYNGA